MTARPYTCATHRPTQLGLVVLQSDESIEPDMQRLLPSDAELLVTRVPSGQHVTAESLAQMEAVLTQATSLLPAGAELSAIGYGCTSGTAQIGVARIHTLIQSGAPGPAQPRVTEPVSALVAACGHLGLRRLGLVSPYVAEVSAQLCRVLDAEGISVVGFASFEESEEAAVARISPDSILEAVRHVASETECDGVFLSCTNLRTLSVIDAAEAAIGRPVLTSNQVLAWHMGRLAHLSTPHDAPGRLWT